MSGLVDLLGLEGSPASSPKAAAQEAADASLPPGGNAAGDAIPAAASRGKEALSTIAFDGEREEKDRQRPQAADSGRYWERFAGEVDADARYIVQYDGNPNAGSIDAVEQARRFIHDAKLRFYMAPPPGDRMVYCSLERHRGHRVVSFDLRRDDTGEFLLAASMDASLMGPVTFHTLKDSHLRGMEDIPSSRDSAVYLGCMMPSFSGTEFRVMDHRVDFRRESDVDRAELTGKYELAMVLYELNVLGRVPNFMRVVMRRPQRAATAAGAPPSPSYFPGRGGGGNGRRTEPILRCWEAQKRREERSQELSINSPIRSMRALMRGQNSGSGAFFSSGGGGASNGGGFSSPGPRGGSSGQGEEEDGYAAVGRDEGENGNDLVVMETKRPSWNEALGAWTLNFNGRVKIPSKKNCILCVPGGSNSVRGAGSSGGGGGSGSGGGGGGSSSGNGAGGGDADFGDGRVLLRHGKMSKSRFSVDFSNPLPPMLALAIVVSTFSDKRFVT